MREERRGREKRAEVVFYISRLGEEGAVFPPQTDLGC